MYSRPQRRPARRKREFNAAAILSILICLAACLAANVARAQERREREPNSVYLERRAKLAAQVDCPVVLLGLTGREESSQAYIFEQEENFYYLTGHNEEGAGLIILPAKSSGNDASNSPREILYLPGKNPQKEKWNGVRMSPGDPGIEARTGFATVRPFAEIRSAVENLAKTYPCIYTILPYEKELGGYPHEKEGVDWLQQAAPQSKLKDLRAQITAMRQIKSPGEIAFLQRAIDLTVDSHLEAMRMMRPGLHEYEVAAKMVEVHAMGGSEAEGYAPIVGRTKFHRAPLRPALPQNRRRRHRRDRRRSAVLRLLRRYHPHHPRQREIHAAPARDLQHRARRAKRRARRAQTRHGSMPKGQEEPLQNFLRLHQFPW